ncbi:hypothetical protein [Algibacter aquimarinus]|uniref:Uncharacterized protein n=1 Tax=Algibacter aquimarinus TaxID=1136748 RepID=A0ABP9HLR5_9FLAO
MRPQFTYLLRLFSLTVLLFVSFSCETESLSDDIDSKSDSSKDNSELLSDCATQYKTDLYAGQHILVGEVSVITNGANYEITYKITNNNYCITSTHLSVVSSPNDFPMGGGGNPKNGHFEYGDDNLSCVKDITYLVPKSKGSYIAAHAVVDYNDEGNSSQETAWASGCDFPGNNWATYFQYYKKSTLDEW